MAAPAAAPITIDESLFYDHDDALATHAAAERADVQEDRLYKWEGKAMIMHDSGASEYMNMVSTESSLPTHVNVVQRNISVFNTVRGILKNVKRIRSRISMRISMRNSACNTRASPSNRLGIITENEKAHDDKMVHFRVDASFVSAVPVTPSSMNQNLSQASDLSLGQTQSQTSDQGFEDDSLESLTERMRAWSVKVLGDSPVARPPEVQAQEQELSSSFQQIASSRSSQPLQEASSAGPSNMEEVGNGHTGASGEASVPAREEAQPMARGGDAASFPEEVQGPEGNEGAPQPMVRLRTRTMSWQTVSAQEEEATKWLESMSSESRGNQEFASWLHNGQLLCDVANKLQPGIVPKVSRSNQTYHERENIKGFIEACRTLGVPERELFNTNDLYTDSNVPNVTRCVMQLAAAANGGG